MFPPLLLISSFSYKYLYNKLKIIMCITAFIFIILISYLYFPVYSAYYTPILGGTETALKLGIYDNSGEYYAQAADYLSLKDRKNHVYVPYNYESFSYYYNGNMQRDYDINTDFLVTSVEHLNEVAIIEGCLNIDKTFGTKVKNIVFVLSCK